MVKGSLLKIAGVVLAGVLAVSLLGCGAPAPPPPTEKEEIVEVRVGQTRSLTGLAAAYLIRNWRGFDDYGRYVLETNPIPGVKIINVWEETGYIADRYIAAYANFKAAGVVMLVMMESAATLALGERMRADKIPGVTMTTSTDVYFHPEFATKGPGYIFPSSSPAWDGSRGGLGPVIMEKWKAAGQTRKPKVAIINVDWSSALVGFEIVSAYWKYLGIELLPEAIYPMTTTELATPIARARDMGADFIVHNAHINFVPMFIKDVARLGIERGVGPGKIDITVSALSRFAMEKVEPGIAEGYWQLYTQPAEVLNWGIPGLEVTHPTLKLMDEISLKYHGVAYQDYMDLVGVNQFTVMYDVIKRAAAKYGPKGVTTATVYEMFTTTTNLDIAGVYQLVTFTDIERRAFKDYILVEWRGGKFVQVGDKWPMVYLTPDDAPPELAGFRIPK